MGLIKSSRNRVVVLLAILSLLLLPVLGGCGKDSGGTKGADQTSQEAAKPSDSSKSSEPSKAVEPAKPADSSKPADSAKPADSSKPAEPAQPAQAPKQELSKELNLYNWSEYIPQSVLDKFQKEFGVKVNYDAYSSNEEMLAKIQGGAKGYDLVVPSDYTIEVMVKQGLLEKLDMKNIPNFANIDDQFKKPWYDPNNEYTVPNLWGTAGLAYNSKYVKEEPKSYKVLWDPKYKGKIVLLDDSREVIGTGLKVLGYSKNSTDPKELNAAKEELKKLVPNVKAFDSDSPKTLFISNEVWIGLTWNGEAALAMKENPDIRYALPTDGGGRWMDNWAIPKGAPHKYTAEVFINFILRPDIGAEMASAFPYGSPNREAKKLLDSSTVNNFASYPPAGVVSKLEYIKDVGDTSKLYDQIYTELKGQ